MSPQRCRKGPKQNFPSEWRGRKIDRPIPVLTQLESTVPLYTRGQTSCIEGEHEFLVAAVLPVGVTSPVQSERGPGDGVFARGSSEIQAQYRGLNVEV